MTKYKMASVMKRLGKLIESVVGGEYYDLPERFAPTLLDLGYIQIYKECVRSDIGIFSTSEFLPTDQGLEEYFKWIENHHKTKERPQ
jgi:hypothetical protein